MHTIPFFPCTSATTVSAMLHELGCPVHRCGYEHLIAAVERYTQGGAQNLTRELYPYLAQRFGYSDWHAVEHAIRALISDAWADRDPQVWERYFPRCKKAPSNKQVIATLAEFLRQNTPPAAGRGQIVRKMMYK